MARYLIVGGVAGGATVAARLRRNDESAEIILFERGNYISYANCGLPYYIGDVISDREKLFVQTPEGFSKRFNIEVRVHSEVLEIDRKEKNILVRNRDTNETYTESYDKLVLSPGAAPVRPPIPGINDSDVIFTLRNVPDTDQIKQFVEEKKPKRAVIVGAGFIGLEMAENLHSKGIFVTIVEMAEQVMNVIDFEMASMVHWHLKTKNVEFYLKDGVAAFEKRTDERLTVKLNSGRDLVADMVILSIGVKPETGLAEAAGLKTGTLGGIAVNEFLATNDPAIYALGDAIEVFNPVIGKQTLIPLAGPANKQGRIVADNMVYGNDSRYGGTIGTAIAKVFDITVATTGASEKLLRRENIPHLTSITHSASHAGYYPGAIPMAIKLLFTSEGKILGAQIVGFEGVDKRIDVIASLIMSGGTITAMETFEHAYAPPYSSAKDPVNVAGFVAENILRKRVQAVQWYDIDSRDRSNTMLLDVRTKEEFELGTIDDAVNIPVDDLRRRINELPRDKSIIVFCGVGLRGYVAIRILMQHGFEKLFNLSGGYKTYEYVVSKQENEDIYSGDVIGRDDHIYQTDVDKPKHTEHTIYECDATGLQCPGPIMQLKKRMETIAPGDRLKIRASDPGFFADVKSWCNVTGNMLVSLENEKGVITSLIEKASDKPVKNASGAGENKTIIVFSDDFDKALASFVIANGALAMGRKVTMFFTFWGLNVIKRKKKPRTKKDLMGAVFGKMLPGNSEKLGMSKMNFAGMGPAMMRSVMKSKNIDSLETMIRSALDAGIDMIACQMSMDVMGVSNEELIDGVRIGGVATYLEETESSNLNLFI